MKNLKLNLLSFSICFALIACAQDAKKEETATLPLSDQTVEASCGMCMFGMETEGCELAVKIDDKTYIVEGGEKYQGDAHAEDGICNVIRKAKVSGEVTEGRFVASSFEMLPYKKEE